MKLTSSMQMERGGHLSLIAVDRIENDGKDKHHQVRFSQLRVVFKFIVNCVHCKTSKLSKSPRLVKYCISIETENTPMPTVITRKTTATATDKADV